MASSEFISCVGRLTAGYVASVVWACVSIKLPQGRGMLSFEDL